MSQTRLAKLTWIPLLREVFCRQQFPVQGRVWCPWCSGALGWCSQVQPLDEQFRPSILHSRARTHAPIPPWNVSDSPVPSRAEGSGREIRWMQLHVFIILLIFQQVFFNWPFLPDQIACLWGQWLGFSSASFPPWCGCFPNSAWLLQFWILAAISSSWTVKWPPRWLIDNR